MKQIIIILILCSVITSLAMGIDQSLSSESFSLTVISSTTVFANGKSQFIPAGEKITGLSKNLWYKVILENSKEGWVCAYTVEEPIYDFFGLGYGAYMSGSYEAAVDYFNKVIDIDPTYVSAYLWLAKSYDHRDDSQAAYQAITEALQIDKDDESCKLFAQQLSWRYFDMGRTAFKAGRYSEAIENYQKVVELKPDSDVSWIELGKCYKRLGLPEKAYSAWVEALRANPDAENAYVLLGTKYYLKVAVKPKTKEIEPILSPELANESLNIVKMEKTKKGTAIETALKSLLTLTKSLGEQVAGKGWDVKMNNKDILVSYIVERGKDVPEIFEWVVDVNTKQVLAHNDNARLLMSRW